MIIQGRLSLVYENRDALSHTTVPCSLNTETGKLKPIFKRYGMYKDIREYYKSAGYTLHLARIFEGLPCLMSDEDHSVGRISYPVCPVCQTHIMVVQDGNQLCSSYHCRMRPKERRKEE